MKADKISVLSPGSKYRVKMKKRPLAHTDEKLVKGSTIRKLPKLEADNNKLVRPGSIKLGSVDEEESYSYESSEV